MFSSLRAEYEYYKALPLSLQVLRVSNAMFAIFTFWNMALQADPVLGISAIAESNPIYTISILLLGMLLLGLVIVKVRSQFHYYLLPFIAAAFYLSTPQNPALLLLVIPFCSTVILLSARLIIKMADFINRF